MKTVEVSAAVIIEHHRVFVTQRSYGENKDRWEFPGGKLEKGESAEDALRREIWEELDTQIEVGQRIMTIEYDYPQFHLTMHCFLCSVQSGSLVLKEHEDARWLAADELYSVDWLPADLVILPELQRILYN